MAVWPTVTKSTGGQAWRDANNPRKTTVLAVPVMAKSNSDGPVATRRSSRSVKPSAKNPRKTQNKESSVISRSVSEGQAEEETVEEVHEEAAPIQMLPPLSQLPGSLRLSLGNPPLGQVNQIFLEDLNPLQGLWKHMRHPDVSKTDLQTGLSLARAILVQECSHFNSLFQQAQSRQQILDEMITDFSKEITLVGGTVPVVPDLFSERMAIREPGPSQICRDTEE